MPPNKVEPPVFRETWPECVTSYTQNLSWIYFAFNAVQVLLGRLSIGDFFFNTASSLIASSALHGEHFSKDLQSTITILLYFSGFSLRCFLLFAMVQVFSSQRTRLVYEEAYGPFYRCVYEREEFWAAAERITKWCANVEWSLNYIQAFKKLPTCEGEDKDSFERFLGLKYVALIAWRVAKQPGWVPPPEVPGAVKVWRWGMAKIQGK
jgi:hypothetical protein